MDGIYDLLPQSKYSHIIQLLLICTHPHGLLFLTCMLMKFSSSVLDTKVLTTLVTLHCVTLSSDWLVSSFQNMSRR